MLDRPISEFDGPCDSVRVPVLPPLGECRPFQEVLVELAGRLKLPAFTTADGGRKYKDYPDFIVNYETAPGSGIGFLTGWRGADGTQTMRGAPNPKQWEMYAANNCVHHTVMPPEHQYMRNWNRGYMQWAQQVGLRRDNDPIVIHLYSEFMQRFRLAAQGKAVGPAAAGPAARARGPTSTRCPSGTSRWKSQVSDTSLPAGRGDAAADGDVPLVGLAERLAAPDPRAQPPVRQPGHGHGAGHRRRRLDVGRVALGQGALPAASSARRWSPAPSGPGTPSARPRAPGR
jgi:anaerobic selenocysteine-containing dehydrogenase